MAVLFFPLVPLLLLSLWWSSSSKLLKFKVIDRELQISVCSLR
jgi:hypothetical protein